MLMTATLLLTLATPVQALKPGPDRCVTDANRKTAGQRKAAPRKLGEEPPASQIYTVYNQVNGCPQPVVVRDGIGANAHRRAPVVSTVPRARRVE